MPTPKAGNPVWMLFITYFVPCDLMHQHHLRLKTNFFSGRPGAQEQAGQEFIAFTLYWFASLFVVAEGWRELKLSDPTVDHLIDEHWDSLRKFRNAVFHFQKEDLKFKQFFELEKFNWAGELHAVFRVFFEAHNK